MQCPACDTENAHGKKFCVNCGTGLALRCPACDSPVRLRRRLLRRVRHRRWRRCAPAASAPVSERRHVSVLFADLVGFTTLSESRDSEDVRELLSRYFESSRRLIERYGGTVEKFIGDAVMAVWGTPVAQEDDAERAVRAALDLVASVEALGAEVGAPGLKARVGVLSGEATVNVGAQGQGMVAGDIVNTASRIQSAAAPGQVLAGEATKRASESAIAYEEAGLHELKGKAEPVFLWRALRVVAGARGAQRSTGLEAPFVGRDRELRLVKELFHASAEDGRAQLVSVTGIAGIGKSRLAWEFEKYIDGLAGDRLLASRPLPVLRRRRRVLGARRDGQDALRHRRGRGQRDVAREAAADDRARTCPIPRSGGGSSRGSPTCSASRRACPATRRTSSPPGGSCSSGWPSSRPRFSCSRICSGPTRVCSTSSSTCSSGRASHPLFVLGLARPSSPTGGRPGAPASAASARSTSSRSRSRRWATC